MEVKEIIELMKAVSDNGLTAFELEREDWKLSMKREKKSDGQAAPVIMQMSAGVHQETLAASDVHEDVSSDQVVSCPLVGTFYASPSPDAPNFVKVGDTVKKGQVLGIVEAMKLMNEIESEYDGVVEAVLVKDEETVEYGQPLFRIR